MIRLTFPSPASLCMVAIMTIPALSIAADKDGAATACEVAENARKAAAAVKMEWTTTGKLIKAGNKAIEKGDFASALEFCQKAKFQGDTAVDQASREAAAWRARVPK